MLRLVFTGYILAILTAAVNAGEFLQPWTPRATIKYDYSDNLYYALGVNVQISWDADYTNATIVLHQNNNPGDATGGPSVTLEESYNKTTWGWTVSYEGMDPAYNNVFYFKVAQANGSNSFGARAFNITGASATTESSAAAALSTGSNTSSFTAFSTTPASSGIMQSHSSFSATVTVAPVTLATSSATVTIASLTGGGTPAGTIAGIGVGIVVGSLLLIGGAWWAWKIQKRRSTVASNQLYFFREQRRYEADGNQIYEVHESRPEADGNPIHELHGSVGQPRN